MSVLRLRSHSRGLGLSPRRRAAGGAAPPGIVQDGLVAEYRFDEGSGQVLTDYSGNGHHGRLGTSGGADADDPNWTSEGLIFTGANGDHVECDTAGISGGMARTLIGVAHYTNQLAVGWNGNGANLAPTTFVVKPFNAGGDYFYFENGTGTGVYFNVGAGLLCPDGQYNCMAYTQSGANVNTGIGYVNGVSVPVVGQSGATNLVLNTSGNLFFGKDADGTFHTQKWAYFLVYDRALSAEEIEQTRQALALILAPRGITLP
jgi:hypothetical protein